MMNNRMYVGHYHKVSTLCILIYRTKLYKLYKQYTANKVINCIMYISSQESLFLFCVKCYIHLIYKMSPWSHCGLMQHLGNIKGNITL